MCVVVVVVVVVAGNNLTLTGQKEKLWLFSLKSQKVTAAVIVFVMSD